MSSFRNLLPALGLLLWSAQAFAQTDKPDEPGQHEESADRQVYEAAFFAQFSPATALQMIQHVPGFTLERGDTNVRGFTQAAGNVVINGARPSSKSDTLDTILARIPASNVQRIEVASGSAFGADYAGKPQVANLVLTEAAGLSGILEIQASREYSGRILPKGSAALVYKWGVSSFSASLSHQVNNSRSGEGFDRLVGLPSGTEIEFRERAIRHSEPYTVAALGWAMEEAADRSIHISGKYSYDKWIVSDASEIFQGGAAAGKTLYSEDHLWKTYELSGDIRRPLAGGAITLNALATGRHRRNDDILERTNGDIEQGGFLQNFVDSSGERLARLAWKREGLAGWAIEIGAEGALNRLRSDLNIFNVDEQGESTLVDLPIDHAIVSEYRGEGFANAERALSGNLRLSLGLNFETSHLEVTGDASAKRALSFLKPKGTLAWSPGTWQVQLSVARTAAQLRFADFVSGASFNTGQVSGGNTDLQPQRKWELLLTTSRPILGDGRIKLDFGYNAVSLVQDRIPLKAADPVTGELVNIGLDAPGNLGSGREWIARVNLDLPLPVLGIKGGRLTVTGSYLDSSVRDPYTFADRHFSGATLFSYSSVFRQDFSSFAWGVEVKGGTGSTNFRLDEIDENRGISPLFSAFAEYRPSSVMTVTLGVNNLTNAVSKRWRTFYSPDRTADMPFQQEYRERNSHRLLYLSAKYSFG